MDIHRCRFVPYPPQAINAVAFSHSVGIANGKVPSTLRLAIGRANGDIEIWNPLNGAWFHETTLRGGKDRSIEGLCWTQDPAEDDGNGGRLPGKLRLFSIGYSAVLTEWNLELGRPARHAAANSEIWCIAAQPLWKTPKQDRDDRALPEPDGVYKGQHIAAGCADGSVVLFSTADGELSFLRTMTRPSKKGARALSITFQSQEKRHIVIAGHADSTIRVFDIRNGSIMRNMSLGASGPGGKKELLVWAVRTLPDGTIVSGDSSGELKFWHRENFSLVQRVKSHEADVLDIVTSPEGKRIMSCGVDRRTCVYQLDNPLSNSGEKQPRRWKTLMHSRIHSHDVKCMTSFQSKNLSIVVSGGMISNTLFYAFSDVHRAGHHPNCHSFPRIRQGIPPRAFESPTKAANDVRPCSGFSGELVGSRGELLEDQ